MKEIKQRKKMDRKLTTFHIYKGFLKMNLIKQIKFQTYNCTFVYQNIILFTDWIKAPLKKKIQNKTSVQSSADNDWI